MISALNRLKRIIPSSALGPCPLIKTNWGILRGKEESQALSSRNQSKCFVLVISPLQLVVWVVQGCAGAPSSGKSTSQALAVAQLWSVQAGSESKARDLSSPVPVINCGSGESLVLPVRGRCELPEQQPGCVGDCSCSLRVISKTWCVIRGLSLVRVQFSAPSPCQQLHRGRIWRVLHGQSCCSPHPPPLQSQAWREGLDPQANKWHLLECSIISIVTAKVWLANGFSIN